MLYFGIFGTILDEEEMGKQDQEIKQDLNPCRPQEHHNSKSREANLGPQLLLEIHFPLVCVRVCMRKRNFASGTLRGYS